MQVWSGGSVMCPKVGHSSRGRTERADALTHESELYSKMVGCYTRGQKVAAFFCMQDATGRALLQQAAGGKISEWGFKSCPGHVMKEKVFHFLT